MGESEEGEKVRSFYMQLSDERFYRTKRKKTSERNSIGRRNKQIISFIHTFRLHALLLFSSIPKAFVDSLI